MNKSLKQHLRFISLCIVVVLLVTCFATLLVACGDTDNNNTNNSTSTGDDNSTTGDDNTTTGVSNNSTGDNDTTGGGNSSTGNDNTQTGGNDTTGNNNPTGDNNTTGGGNSSTGDENNSSDDNNQNGVDLALISNIIERYIGYITENKLEELFFSAEVLNSNGNYYQDYKEHYGEGVYLHCTLENCEVLIYDNETHSANALGLLKNNSNQEDNISQTKNVVVIETKQGAYDKIMSSTQSNDFNTSKTYEFAKSTLKSILKENKYDFFSFYISYYNQTNSEFYLLLNPLVGHYDDTYQCSTYFEEEYVKEYTAQIGTEYTDDSYVKLEDNLYYAHLRNKSGFRFEEKDDSYILTHYYYDTAEGANAVIPRENNGKPVTGIDFEAFTSCNGLTAITIPNSVTYIGGSAFENCKNLTSITFQGTMAQWNEIKKGYSWNEHTGNYVVHCTDGDLDKNGNQI